MNNSSNLSCLGTADVPHFSAGLKVLGWGCSLFCRARTERARQATTESNPDTSINQQDTASSCLLSIILQTRQDKSWNTGHKSWEMLLLKRHAENFPKRCQECVWEDVGGRSSSIRGYNKQKRSNCVFPSKSLTEPFKQKAAGRVTQKWHWKQPSSCKESLQKTKSSWLSRV